MQQLTITLRRLAAEILHSRNARLLLYILLCVAFPGCSLNKTADGKAAAHTTERTTTDSSQDDATQTPTGTRADNSLPFKLADLNRTHGACIFFVGTDCPISNAYAPEIGRIVSEFGKNGITFYFIYAIRDLEPQEAAEHATSFELRGQVVLDSQMALAKALGATRMPEVILLPPEGEAVYQGRIDDRYPAPGAKRREHVRTHDLRDALNAFIAGKPIANPRTSAVGRIHITHSRHLSVSVTAREARMRCLD
jgi:hypothetical protein